MIRDIFIMIVINMEICTALAVSGNTNINILFCNLPSLRARNSFPIKKNYFLYFSSILRLKWPDLIVGSKLCFFWVNIIAKLKRCFAKKKLRLCHLLNHLVSLPWPQPKTLIGHQATLVELTGQQNLADFLCSCVDQD